MGRNAVLAVDQASVTEMAIRQAGSTIEVREKQGFKGILAKENISKDSVIFCLKGTISRRRTKYTIQLDSNRHLAFPAIRKPSDHSDYSWQYLNHDCEPNGYVNTAELTFRALRDIAAGEEITFNYLTTESEMAVPFNCGCGSTNCFGFIRGRNFLTGAEAERLSRAVGEEKVVRLFMPAVQKSILTRENTEA